MTDCRISSFYRTEQKFKGADDIMSTLVKEPITSFLLQRTLHRRTKINQKLGQLSSRY